jgi:hypothetical protein
MAEDNSTAWHLAYCKPGSSDSQPLRKGVCDLVPRVVFLHPTSRLWASTRTEVLCPHGQAGKHLEMACLSLATHPALRSPVANAHRPSKVFLRRSSLQLPEHIRDPWTHRNQEARAEAFFQRQTDILVVELSELRLQPPHVVLNDCV